MPRATKHKCALPSCTEQVPLRMLMCLAHWRLVPPDEQAAVWKAYRNRHRGGQYEGDYYNAVKAAVASVEAAKRRAFAAVEERMRSQAQGQHARLDVLDDVTP